MLTYMCCFGLIIYVNCRYAGISNILNIVLKAESHILKFL